MASYCLKNKHPLKWAPFKITAFTSAEGAANAGIPAGKRKVAFTLAEVLITLGIIGIVAAMTLPALIGRWQKAVAVSQLKRSYSIMQNAITKMMADNDGLELKQMPFVYQLWNHSNYLNLDMFISEFTKYLKTTEHGKFGNESDIKFCLPADSKRTYKMLDGTPWNGKPGTVMIVGQLYYAWQLEDGTCIGIIKRGDWTWDDTTSFILLFVDINGSYRNPNTLGKDVFVFQLSPEGKILPLGYKPVNTLTPTCEFNRWGNAQGLSCAMKIMEAGWQMNKDYPW